MYPLLHTIWEYGVLPIAFFGLCIEYPILVIRHIRTVKKATYIYPLFFGSFGHQGVDLHMLAMRFRNKNLLVLLSDYGNYNPYIIDSFAPYVAVRILRHSHFAACTWKRVFTAERLRTIKRVLLHIICAVTGSHAVVLEEFCSQRGEQVTGSYINEYISLLQQHSDIHISPPTAAVEQFWSALEILSPGASHRWFVSLYLRRKRGKYPDVRDTSPLPYRASIERILADGGLVLIGGDYDPHVLFPDLRGVFGYKDLPCSREIADVGMLSQCQFFIGGHSGPLVIATAFNVPALISNNAFFYLSGYRENQRVLWKKLRRMSSRQILSTQETFTLPIVAFIENEPFKAAGLQHVDNTEQEILAATNEMLLLVNGSLT